LPPWAASPFDFAYQHRKALESDFVSLSLHSWINATFRHLFLEPHPPRGRPVSAPFQFRRLLASDFPFPPATHAFLPTPTACVLAGTAPPAVRRLSLDDSAGRTLSISFQFLSADASALAGTAETAAIAGPSSALVELASGRSLAVPAAGAAAASGAFAAFVCTDQHLRVYFRAALAFSARLYAAAACVAVSAKFSLAVVGTDDGSMLWFDLRSGCMERAVRVGAPVERVAIAEGWGMAVCACRPGLVVFGADGARIGAVPLDGGVAAWDFAVSGAGSDLATVVLMDGEVFHFELFPMAVGPVRARVEGATAVRFVAEWGAIAIVDRGSIQICPL
jgi:hypothetical protein